MKQFTLKQLKWAKEMAFGEDVLRILKKEPDQADAMSFYLLFKRKEQRLIEAMFTFSRAHLESDLGDMFNRLLTELIGDYK